MWSDRNATALVLICAGLLAVQPAVAQQPLTSDKAFQILTPAAKPEAARQVAPVKKSPAAPAAASPANAADDDDDEDEQRTTFKVLTVEPPRKSKPAEAQARAEAPKSAVKQPVQVKAEPAPQIQAKPVAQAKAEPLPEPKKPALNGAPGEGQNMVMAGKADPVTTQSAKQMELAKTAHPNVRLLRPGNELIAEANRRARDTIAEFVIAGAKAGAGDKNFAVKVALTSNGETEHIWVGAIRADGRGGLVGTLANEPLALKGYKLGDTLPVRFEDASDWTYVKADGRMMGNFTACAVAAVESDDAVAMLEQRHKADCSWLRQANIAAH